MYLFQSFSKFSCIIYCFLQFEIVIADLDVFEFFKIDDGILPDRTNRIEDIYLRFYNGSTGEEYVDFPLGQASRLFEIKGFDKNNPTVLYIHGFIETAQQESVQVMVSAYLEAKPSTNVVLLDWSNMSHGSYLVNAARNTKKVGAAAAEQIYNLLESGLQREKLHVIGHSLGSHVAGYTARELKNKYQTTVKRLTALDPAFPAFYPDGVMMEHVSAKDAEFVDVIHTDAGGYGAPVRTGTADFWPNGGKSIQPGCPRFMQSLEVVALLRRVDPEPGGVPSIPCRVLPQVPRQPHARSGNGLHGRKLRYECTGLLLPDNEFKNSVRKRHGRHPFKKQKTTKIGHLEVPENLV
ncbi:endothelial lipase-like isoform X1 [Cydia strobilella]|uniref:endothelial lipase-like isoform X1 n=1 Tax=Cydia strobilella TaxID=1100964 RepID=UPI00300440E4